MNGFGPGDELGAPLLASLCVVCPVLLPIRRPAIDPLGGGWGPRGRLRGRAPPAAGTQGEDCIIKWRLAPDPPGSGAVKMREPLSLPLKERGDWPRGQASGGPFVTAAEGKCTFLGAGSAKCYHFRSRESGSGA